MRRVWSTLLSAGLLSACGEQTGPRDVTLEITMARVGADSNDPEALATLDVVVELEATTSISRVTVPAVVLQELPSGPEVEFDVIARGPRDAAIIELPPETPVVVRLSNLETEVEQIRPLCGAAATLSVEVEADDLVRQAARDITVRCS